VLQIKSLRFLTLLLVNFCLNMMKLFDTGAWGNSKKFGQNFLDCKLKRSSVVFLWIHSVMNIRLKLLGASETGASCSKDQVSVVEGHFCV
jgi:hypothetical protein